MTWKAMQTQGSTSVVYTTFSMKHGLGKQRHRGFVGRIWKRDETGKRPRDIIEGCGHAHKTRTAAETCARRWAKRRNKIEAEAVANRGETTT